MTHSCTLDERSARLILPGREQIQDDIEFNSALRLNPVNPSMKRNAALNAMTKTIATTFGRRILVGWRDKRSLTAIIMTLRSGVVHFGAYAWDYGKQGLRTTRAGDCVFELNEHCVARMLQRLRTTEMNDIWWELTPLRQTLPDLLRRRDEVPAGMVARLPTSTGHLVVRRDARNRLEAATWLPDLRAGDERKVVIQTARADNTFIVEPANLNSNSLVA